MTQLAFELSLQSAGLPFQCQWLLKTLTGTLNGVPPRHPSTLFSSCSTPCHVIKNDRFVIEFCPWSWGGWAIDSGSASPAGSAIWGGACNVTFLVSWNMEDQEPVSADAAALDVEAWSVRRIEALDVNKVWNEQCTYMAWCSQCRFPRQGRCGRSHFLEKRKSDAKQEHRHWCWIVNGALANFEESDC